MKSFDSRAYAINDFREWNDRGLLKLDPRFQRRSVWKKKAKSYLIDTILRGKPLPKIFIRQLTDAAGKKTVREVVDGQQRLRTILAYLDDGFRVSKGHHREYGGRFFSELPEDVRTSLLEYEVSTDLLLDAKDAEVLEIFSRLNSYTVTLNAQEKLNAEFFGSFKNLAYELARTHLEFWRKMFTDHQILRMSEAEFVSEVLVAMLDGIKTRKALRTYYKRFDEDLPNEDRLRKSFVQTIDFIGGVYGEDFGNSNFSRPHMAYTLFTVVFHELSGLKGCDVKRVRLGPSSSQRVKAVLDEIDEFWDREDLQGKENKFFEAARRATTDATVRQSRTDFICERLASRLA